ncbi:MAG: hypothetical protein IJ794_06835 [Lachnospiraceae bacterium]|nr:hypothetical protein [Lachnospiraceae bacterium]
MKYLFSPIGGNDPVSSATEHDGSMLHICRHYLPDEVWLYLSREMTKRHRRDNRYCYSIEQLGKAVGHTFQVKCIEDEELNEVQEYDYYYAVFEPILKEISDRMAVEDVLYVNIASGTPAMKSALLLLAVMSDKRIVPVQVVTPERDINRHPGKDPDYDPEYYWEVNQDNAPEAANRCREPELPNLNYRLKRQSLIRFVESYNYSAALMLGQELKSELPEQAYILLEYAVARMQFDFDRMKKLGRIFPQEEKKRLCPVWDEVPGDKDRDMEKTKIFEYALSLKVKILRKEYGDFVRAISPLVTDLFEILLRDLCSISIKPYIAVNSSGVRVWRKSKLGKDAIGATLLQILDQEYAGKGGGFQDNKPVAADNLKPLLMHYLSDDKLKQDVDFIRYIEGKIRNLAAHEIVSIRDDNIKDYVEKNVTIQEIYYKLQHLTQVALGIQREHWNSYDEMNRLISEKLI